MFQGVAVLVLAFVLPIAAAAQTVTTGADLAGTVHDPSGAVLPGATVTVVNLGQQYTAHGGQRHQWALSRRRPVLRTLSNHR
jgi:hypothetical protein